MAVRLQTNHFYNGNDFLDSRHSIANSTDDLLNWFIDKKPEDLIIIPEGFEVYLPPSRETDDSGIWYIYEPNKTPNEITGFFHPRPKGIKEGFTYVGINKEFGEIELDDAPENLLSL